jgi:hypothetical protein
MEVFEQSKGGGTFRFDNGSWVPFSAKKLNRFGLCPFTPAVVETEVMDPIDVENRKVIVSGRYRSEASFTGWMA